VGTPTNPLIGMYRTADGRFLALSMLQGFHYWPEFCERIGRQDLVTDERFATVESLMANAPEACRIVADELGSRKLAEWRQRFEGMKGQWAVAQNTLDVADDPQVIANGYLQELETADGVPFTLVAAPVQFDDEPAMPRRAPTFNEHGDELLAEHLGIDWDTIIELKTKGIVP
jgi:crotonobetainyl-CoA:carnitine CoA-transferase CaiB-like acyl-CoA transferase